MGVTIMTGILLIAVGVAVFVISQLLLRRWIRNYDEKWQEGSDSNDVS